MSKTLYIGEGKQRRYIWRLGENSSQLFLGIAQIVAKMYGIPTGLYIDGSPSWRIEPDEFCVLVEKVFEKPYELLHPWAQEAAGIYEVIKGEIYIWEWNQYGPSNQVFNVCRPANVSPNKHSQKRIGSIN